MLYYAHIDCYGWLYKARNELDGWHMLYYNVTGAILCHSRDCCILEINWHSLVPSPFITNGLGTRLVLTMLDDLHEQTSYIDRPIALPTIILYYPFSLTKHPVWGDLFSVTIVMHPYRWMISLQSHSQFSSSCMIEPEIETNIIIAFTKLPVSQKLAHQSSPVIVEGTCIHTYQEFIMTSLLLLLLPPHMSSCTLDTLQPHTQVHCKYCWTNYVAKKNRHGLKLHKNTQKNLCW